MQSLKGNKSVWVSLVVIIVAVLVIYFIVKSNNRVEVVEDINSINQEQVADDSTNEQPVNTQENMEKISKKGDVLVMNYTGRLIDGTVFDSNVDPKFGHVTPFRFMLGAGQVIAGWDEGLIGMKVGEKKTLTIPPEKGYGSRAVGPIPANSTLIFEVELVGIE